MVSSAHRVTVTQSGALLEGRRKRARVWEFLVESTIRVSGVTAIAIVVLILVFLLRDSLPLFFRHHYPMGEFFAGRRWLPISSPPAFGVLPLIMGSLLVTAGATVLAVPLGVACAVYIGEVARPRVREMLKPAVEMLAAVPSVVLGFIGLLLLAPALKNLLGLPTGLTALTGAMILALMALPTVVSVAEDAIASVPRDYREASLALGATPLQTVWRVLLPSARSGIIAAAMLGIGRAVGETMAVMMVTGNAGVCTLNPLRSVRTMTATIAAEMGETSHFSDHYCALFAIAVMLFLITLVINLVADIALRGVKRGIA